MCVFVFLSPSIFLLLVSFTLSLSYGHFYLFMLFSSYVFYHRRDKYKQNKCKKHQFKRNKKLKNYDENCYVCFNLCMLRVHLKWYGYSAHVLRFGTCVNRLYRFHNHTSQRFNLF